MSTTAKRYRIVNGGLKAIEKAAAIADGTVGENWVEGWISPEVIDQSGEVVPVNEWDLSDHIKNPVAFTNHNRKGPVVGRWEHPDGKYAIEKRNGGLWGRCYFNTSTPEGMAEYESYKGKFKRGFSPGFIGIPSRGQFRGKSATIIKQAKLLEVSLVGLPDNQEALAVYCKSLNTFPGNSGQAIPPGHVLRFGALKVSDQLKPEVPTVEQPKGVKAYYAKFNSFLDSISLAKQTLLAELPEGEERNKAYGLLQPLFDGVTSLAENAKQFAPEHDWTAFEKQIGEVFEGFTKFEKSAAVVEAPVIDEAALHSIIDARVQSQIAEPIERINQLQDAFARVDGDVGGLTEVIEKLVTV